LQQLVLPEEKQKVKKGGNLEYKQKVKNKGQLLLGDNPKATTHLCRCNGKKGRFLLGGDKKQLACVVAGASYCSKKTQLLSVISLCH